MNSKSNKYYDLESFNSATLIFKADEVFGFGDFIEFYEFDQFDVFLYAYSDFYVEVECTEHGNRIANIRAISSSDTIDKYLNGTSLETELATVLDS